MRFSSQDWLRLITAYALSSLLLVGLSRAGMGFSASRSSTTPMLAMGLTVILALIVQPLAAWLVLRRCIGGLDLKAWVLAVALGWLLGAIACLPAFSVLPRSMLFYPYALSGHPLNLLVLSVTVIAAGIAFSLPPGILLRRLSGVGAWPFVLAGGMSIVATEVVAPTAARWIRLSRDAACTGIDRAVAAAPVGRAPGTVRRRRAVSHGPPTGTCELRPRSLSHKTPKAT